jgi:hypothetical protein
MPKGTLGRSEGANPGFVTSQSQVGHAIQPIVRRRGLAANSRIDIDHFDNRVRHGTAGGVCYHTLNTAAELGRGDRKAKAKQHNRQCDSL